MAARFAVVAAALAAAAAAGAGAAVLPMEAGTCAPRDFMCFDGEGCLAPEKVCDGVPDCADKTDEYDCEAGGGGGAAADEVLAPPSTAPSTPPTPPFAFNTTKGCLPGEHQCVDGTCISGARVCNGRAECVDGSDELEKLCQERKTAEEAEDAEEAEEERGGASPEVTSAELPVPPSADEDEAEWLGNCSHDQFRCKSGHCVAASAICNGVVDCADESDESAPCPTKGPCASDAFECDNGECVPRAWVCDGHPECRDASDEAAAVCAKGGADTRAELVDAHADASHDATPAASWPGACKGMKPPMLQECREVTLHQLQVETLKLQQLVAREALESERDAAVNAKALHLERLRTAELQREAADEHRRQQQVLFAAQLQLLRSKPGFPAEDPNTVTLSGEIDSPDGP